jgi:hypothetical protein
MENYLNLILTLVKQKVDFVTLCHYISILFTSWLRSAQTNASNLKDLSTMWNSFSRIDVIVKNNND